MTKLFLLQSYVWIFYAVEIAFLSEKFERGTENIPFVEMLAPVVGLNANSIVSSINQSLFDKIIIRTVCFIEFWSIKAFLIWFVELWFEIVIGDPFPINYIARIDIDPF